MTYRTVPRTASVPEYGIRTFHVKDRERSNIEAACGKDIKKMLLIIFMNKKYSVSSANDNKMNK